MESKVEKIFFNAKTNSYSASFRFKDPHMVTQLISVGNGKAQLENFFNWKIKSAAAESIVEILKHLYSRLQIPDTDWPTQYDILTEWRQDLIKTIKPENQPVKDIFEENKMVEDMKPSLDEFPDLNMKHIKARQGWITIVPYLPTEVRTLLLENKGENIKKLTWQMKKRVEYTFLNSRQNNLEIFGRSQIDVKNGYACFVRLVNTNSQCVSIMQQAKVINPTDYTHIISFPAARNPEIMNLISEIRDNFQIQGLQDSMFVDPDELHITLGLVSIKDEQESSLVVQRFQELNESIRDICGGAPLSINLRSLSTFGKTSQANVLFLEPADDCELAMLQQVNTALVSGLQEIGHFKPELLSHQKLAQTESGDIKQNFHLSLICTSLGRKTRGQNPVRSLNFDEVLASNPEINIRITTDWLLLSASEEFDENGYYKPIAVMNFIN